jgi:hypothetical protein
MPSQPEGLSLVRNPTQPNPTQGCLPAKRFIAVISLASLLVFAGIGKLIPIGIDKSDGSNVLFFSILGFVELSIALSLIWNTESERYLAWCAAAMLGLGFLAYFIWRRLQGEDVFSSSCGCLGHFEVTYLPSWLLLSTYVVLLGFASSRRLEPHSYRKVLPLTRFLSLNALSACLLGTTFAFLSNLGVREDFVSFFIPMPVAFVDRVGLPTKRIDAGRVKVDSVVKLPVAIKNSGHRPIRIIGHKQSCRCASLLSSPDILNPGVVQASEIKFESPATVGDFDVMLTIYLDEPTQHQVSTSFHFQVVPDL